MRWEDLQETWNSRWACVYHSINAQWLQVELIKFSFLLRQRSWLGKSLYDFFVCLFGIREKIPITYVAHAWYLVCIFCALDPTFLDVFPIPRRLQCLRYRHPRLHRRLLRYHLRPNPEVPEASAVLEDSDSKADSSAKARARRRLPRPRRPPGNHLWISATFSSCSRNFHSCSLFIYPTRWLMHEENKFVYN